ncbi:MAG: DnaB-like helicase C-terminal domain-containing protein [Candidatus Moraniibacteriota bacterium]
MGQQKQYNDQVAPSKVLPEVFGQYESALQVLANRCLAEPYNMHQIDAAIVPDMLNGSLAAKIVGECQRQFRDIGRYTPRSVADALQIRPDGLHQMAQRDAEADLSFSFDAFLAIFGRLTELQIAEFTCGWVMQGKNSEEIRIEADKMRRQRGVMSKPQGSDGRAEFEAELFAALDGKVVDYPVRPPIQSMRDFVPYHEPGDYIIVGGRTGMGKSFLAMNYIYHAAQSGIPSAYINLENTPKNVQKRLWQMHSGTRWRSDLSGLSDTETRAAVQAWDQVKAMPVKSHNTGRGLQNILNAIRADYYERGIQLAVIDYIQLMKDQATRGNRVDVLAEVSAEVRALTLDLNIVLVAMAQISRSGTDAGDNRPQLTGLRGSGDLEQDATMAMLLYRPDYYQITEDENGAFPPGYADIHIAKGRETGPGLVKCRFDEIRGFYDPEPESAQFPTTAAQPIPRMNEEDIPF